MHIRLFFTIISLLLWQTSFAETCPSVDHIKKHSLNSWKLYDTDDDKPVSSKRAAQFAKNVEQFALAEWADKGTRYGEVHCYYRDSNGSELEAYLAKDHFALQNTNDYWYKVSGFMHCAAGTDKCLFQPNELLKSQLAKK